MFYIQDVTNAPNFITSDEFNAYIISSDFQRIAELSKDVKLTWTNTIPGDIIVNNLVSNFEVS